jgi:hypothetical protein
MPKKPNDVRPMWSCICPTQDVDPDDPTLCAYCGLPIASGSNDSDSGEPWFKLSEKFFVRHVGKDDAS